MSFLQQHRERVEQADEQRAASDESPVTASARSPSDSTLFRLGRGLFGAGLAFMASNTLRNVEAQVTYAESNGAPMPETTVPMVSSSLLVGSIGIALWRAPAIASSLVAAFFISVTPVMHDFWALDDPEQKRQQQIHFLKNTALLGATLGFLGCALAVPSTDDQQPS